MILSQYLGDSSTHTIPLTRKGVAFSPGDDWNLLFTAKASVNDADEDALVQKVSGAGIEASTSNALVEIIPVDTNSLEPVEIFWDIQAENLTTGEVATVAIGRLKLARDVSRNTQTSIPVFTADPSVPYTGPVGAQGPAGPKGDTGATGATGPAGSDATVTLANVNSALATGQTILSSSQSATTADHALSRGLGDARYLGISSPALTVVTNANLTGIVSSVGNLTSIADSALSIAKTSGLQAALNGKVDNAITVNGSPLSANVTITNITGNSATATALQTPRTINGVSFNGTANIGQDLQTTASPTFVSTRSTGGFTDTTTAAGLYTGLLAGTPRLLFANGNAAQNWQIDNDSGNFRWYLPGVVHMTLTPTTLSIRNLVASESIFITGNSSLTGTVTAGAGIIQSPPTTATPANNGQMLFERTSNTQLTIKVKGSDGVVRSAVITLA